jgi:hypothetical protein
MFSTRPRRVQTDRPPGRSNHRPVPVLLRPPPAPLPDPSPIPPDQGIRMSLMLSVTALTAVAKIGPSSVPLAAQ